MIINCDCGARLKLGDDKITAAGVKFKCPRCGRAHVARRTEQTAGASLVRPEPAMPWFAPETSTAALRQARSKPLVLVAHDSQVVASMIDGVLQNAGMATAHAANGLEALNLAIELKPQVMVVDVGLTGIYGFELCERLKGDPKTKDIKIILLSSVYGLTAYKRAPVNLYGADDYIEKHHIPDTLVLKVQGLLAPVSTSGPGGGSRKEEGPTQTRMGYPRGTVPETGESSATPRAENSETRETRSILPRTPVTLPASRRRHQAITSRERTTEVPPAEKPVPHTEAVAPAAESQKVVPSSMERQGGSPTLAATKRDASFFEQEEFRSPSLKPQPTKADPGEVEKAKRFARIIVSDIALYNQEAVIEGIRNGTFYDLLKDDISEGRSVYEQRVPESVRRTGDYLQEAFDNFIASKKKLR